MEKRIVVTLVPLLASMCPGSLMKLICPIGSV